MNNTTNNLNPNVNNNYIKTIKDRIQNNVKILAAATNSAIEINDAVERFVSILNYDINIKNLKRINNGLVRILSITDNKEYILQMFGFLIYKINIKNKDDTNFYNTFNKIFDNKFLIDIINNSKNKNILESLFNNFEF
ncbi:MAG: hypothetical protein ACP5RQ_03065 [Candidatus Micrarchaeia archaeon]